MAFPFSVVEHTFKGQHYREVPATVAGDDENLQLHAKQYIPLNNPKPQPGDLSIIACHANGFCKEVYEPLWEDLLTQCNKHNLRIRSIWMADIAQQGTSGLLNETKLGRTASWSDHARDLLLMINTFSSLLPAPLIGIGHSMGAAQILSLSSLHPRLLHSIALLDPLIWPSAPNPSASASRLKSTALRRDRFPDLHTATSKLESHPFFAAWDPRARSRYLQYAFRPAGEGVTLRTPKAQETFMAFRPTLDGGIPPPEHPHARRYLPDADPGAELPGAPFVALEPRKAWMLLPGVRPRVLFVHGEGSVDQTAEVVEMQVRATGIGPGGNGGREVGAVRNVRVDGGHFMCMLNPRGVAEVLGGWLRGEMEGWREERGRWEREWVGMGIEEKQGMSQEVVENVRKWDGQAVGASKL